MQEPRQSSAARGENHAKAQLHNPWGERGGGRLPCLADLGQKATAGTRGFGKEFVAAVAIIARCGCGDDYWRWSGESSEDAAKGARGIHPAAEDEAFVGGGPAMSGQVCASQVNRGEAAL